MKKKILSLLSVLLCLVALMSGTAIAAFANKQTNKPSRIINLVFDDSGSMIYTNKTPVDTWCQAKYSMEVFAAMLGERDTMNVYFMSDFDNDEDLNAASLTLSGKDGAKTNVAKIHNMPTDAGNTPFAPVRKAYEDLFSVSADEKWLVVFTDGKFQNTSDEEISSFFRSKSSSVSVMFLGMGADAALITSDSAHSIFADKAENNSEILNKITGICTRVFNSNRLDVSVASKSFEFDVPMSELTVFAQGENVSISSLKNADGTTIKSNTSPVQVKHSEIISDTVKKNFADKNAIVYNNTLEGSIVTFEGDFDPGKYTIEVENAKAIEVYYKPNIEIAAHIIDSSGNEVTDMSELRAGEYTLNFGFVKAGTNIPVNESKLLGNITYEAIFSNNGQINNKIFNQGDKVTIDDGSISIRVTAKYLDYNTVTTDVGYNIFSDKDVDFTTLQTSELNITGNTFPAPEDCRTTIKATVNGMEFTQQQWAQMGIPLLVSDDNPSLRIDHLTITKSDEPGIYYIEPAFTNTEIRHRPYDVTQNFSLSFEEQVGPEVWSGSTSGSIKYIDGRSFIDQNLELIIFLAIVALLLLIIILYIPGVKKYLPRGLQSRPLISVRGITTIKNERLPGRFVKYRPSRYLPLRAQRGEVTFLPPGSPGAPKKIIIVAVKNNRFRITNIKSFVGKTAFSFNGISIPKDADRKEIKKISVQSRNLQISYKTADEIYTCQLSTKFNK